MSPLDPERPARMKDVAAAAGVSLKTVTNVVHRRTNVKEETRSRVQDAIDQLGYRPSIAGRQLRSGRSQTIILAVPRIDEPYFAALAHAVIEAAQAAGYTVMIAETSGLLPREVQLVSGRHGQFIDGIILSSLAIDSGQLLDLRDGSPLVLLGEHIQTSGLDLVTIDNLASAADLVRHLVATGRQRIAFVGNQPDGPRGTGEVRIRGYHQAMADAGLPVGAGWVVDAPHFTRDCGESVTQEVLGLAGVEAVVCGNDLLALGLIRGLAAAGTSSPTTIAVTGWDHIPEGRLHAPSLTTIAPDLEEIAARAVAGVLRLLGGQPPEGTTIVPHRLVVNESSAVSASVTPASRGGHPAGEEP